MPVYNLLTDDEKLNGNLLFLVGHLFSNIFRVVGYCIAFLAIVLSCFHFWSKYNSERTIEQLISWGSKGKLKGSIDKIETNYFNNSIHISGISIFTVDTSEQATSNKFNVRTCTSGRVRAGIFLSAAACD